MHASGHREKCPRPRCPGQRTCAVQASTTRRPVYASIYVKGLLLLVPPPRSGGYDVYIYMWSMLLYVICLLHVYVCYMLLYVICL